MKLCPKLQVEQIDELSAFINQRDRELKEVKRAQAILLLNQEIDIPIIVSTTGYHRRQIYEARKNYLEKGLDGIITKRKGKPRELLTKKQLKEIITIVKEKESPLRFGYGSKFWTTGMLADFIERTYRVKYKSKTSYYIIFKRVKFTYHKPGRVWERQNPETIKKWKKDNRPKLKKAWNDPNIVILCEDEMKLSTQTTFQKIWLPAGEYPNVEVSNTKRSKSIYGFLNLKTGQEHAFKTDWQNMYITKEQLEKIRLIYPDKKILLLWDGPGSHRGGEVTDFIKADGKIKIIFFPPYTPEINPQEDVWNKGREQVSHNNFIPDIEKTTDNFVDYLNKENFPYSLLGFSAKS